ncbi:MAG TPA: DNA polymerase III subunit alpha, partial [Candidatus Yonathbacteria bacterium]|nr:DNA polymerase III subunit alpha [Candidatus Yonathbacteria bacterium]
IGVEAYITPTSRHDKQPGIDTTRYHLTLLAKNNIGYQNLIKLVTLSQLEGYYYKPRMDKEILRKYSEGLICLSGCFGGELSKAIRSGDIELARKVALEHQEIFGKENYFLEIMHHPNVPGIEDVRKEIVGLSKELKIPLVGTQDSHYLHSDDKQAHETLLAIQTNADLNDENRFSMAGEDFSFINTKTAEKYFEDTPEAVTNTQKIADMCDIELELGSWVFPDLKIETGRTYDEELYALAYAGIKTRGLEKTKEVTDRLEYELDIIKAKGYSPYFLVVADLLRFARESNIFTTIRGSVAGSLTTYLLGITTIDPLEFKIPFERFLYLERPSAPDIDMDFADNRRDEVLDYARQKYGENNVAQIGTFGTMLARGAVRDVARALGHEYAVGDKISKLIPLGSQGFPMTIDHAIEITPELAELYKKDTTTKEVIDLAKKLEGCVRHISVHAAGVVIAPTKLWDFVPTQFDPKGGKVITQYDMHAVEDAGLLKFDFLGIRNLAILSDAVRLAKKFHNVDIDIGKIPLDDKKTFAMLTRGETMGIFQLNGSGMTQYLKELKPETIHDINAMVALYRPGPMGNIPHYIARKHGNEQVTYLDPRMKEILNRSYGILTYQDDVLLVAINIAGYTWLEADQFRKAMGKKIPKIMAAQEEKFISGCVDSGTKHDTALKIWQLIEPFAAYGFGKAHAASYGMLAYQTAYMKANYPTEYMTAVLTADSGDIDKIAEIIGECKRMEIPVLPPDINESFGNFTVIKSHDKGRSLGRSEGDGKRSDLKARGAYPTDKIRFGLYTIKNLGTDISNAIISERKENGKFKSFSNFLERITHKNLNKKSLEALIMSGAMDKLGERGALLFNTEDALTYNKELSNGPRDQGSLFGELASDSIAGFQMKEAEEASKTEKLAWEKELLGLYISGHPLDAHKKKFEGKDISIKNTRRMREGMLAITAGLVEDCRQINTKKGDAMAFVKIADYNDSIEMVAFPKIYSQFKELLQNKERCLKVKGRISERNGEKSIILDAVKEL